MAVQLSQTPVVEHEIPIGELHKNDHERYVVSAFENSFGTFVNVREWFRRGDLPWRPGRQGMCIPAALAADVAELIHRAAPDPAELELDDAEPDHVAADVARPQLQQLQPDDVDDGVPPADPSPAAPRRSRRAS